MPVKSVNPATEELIAEYPETDADTVDMRLDLAQKTARCWKSASFTDRTKRLQTLAELLRNNADELARLMTTEMGKPVSQAKAEARKCAWVCDFYAEHAEEFLSPRHEKTDATRSYVRYDPLGVVLAIMPWNFPFWQVFRCAAPGVAAGNAFVLKHASNVSGVALRIAELFTEADFPTGIFTNLLIGSDQMEDLIARPEIQAVTLTGSARAGKVVAAAAGKHLKPSVLELGGSDPFIVLADTDIPSVANQAAQARCQNNGQSCIAAKRFIVEQAVVDEFQSAFVEEMQSLKVGDPMDESTDVGPMARKDLRETLHKQVMQSVDQGANVLCGGEVPPDTGYYYPPTVLGDVKPGMPAFDEETFGPVAAVIRAADADEAVQLANRSSYGLGASIWTSDTKRAEELSVDIESGAVFIGDIVKSNPKMPFGGIKRSGYGRELSREGIREFVNVKTVWVK